MPTKNCLQNILKWPGPKSYGKVWNDLKNAVHNRSPCNLINLLNNVCMQWFVIFENTYQLINNNTWWGGGGGKGDIGHIAQWDFAGMFPGIRNSRGSRARLCARIYHPIGYSEISSSASRQRLKPHARAPSSFIHSPASRWFRSDKRHGGGHRHLRLPRLFHIQFHCKFRASARRRGRRTFEIHLE